MFMCVTVLFRVVRDNMLTFGQTPEGSEGVKRVPDRLLLANMVKILRTGTISFRFW